VTEVDIGMCAAGGDMSDAVGVLGVAFSDDPLATLTGGCAGGSSGSGSAGDVHVGGHPNELDGGLVGVWVGELGMEMEGWR
jgi:hypothetical protein